MKRSFPLFVWCASPSGLEAYRSVFLLIAFSVGVPACCSGESVDAALEPSDAAAVFQTRDIDKDGKLTDDEYIANDKSREPVLRRDFKVFDTNADGRLSLAEFLSIPSSSSEEQRSSIVDPVVLLAQLTHQSLIEKWTGWDTNKDGALNDGEFMASGFPDQLTGLKGTKLKDWDRDGNGSVSLEDAALTIDIAFGIRSLAGELLRQKTGRIVDWKFFHGLKPDEQGKVTREKYLLAMKDSPNPEEWYRTIVKDDKDSFGFGEFSNSGHRTDPVNTFLMLDTDLDGRVAAAELATLPPDRQLLARRFIPAFDDDKDGVLSLQEFLLTPLSTLYVLASWQAARDLDNDGKLTPEEFQFEPKPALAMLSAEYFKRLDLNRDHSLSLDEWPFHTNHLSAKFQFLDKDFNGELSESEFIAEGSLPVERLRRDFIVFDANGDGRMTLTELLALPIWIPPEQRNAIADPIVRLSATYNAEMMSHWRKWDRDEDGLLDSSEFENASPGSLVFGMDKTTFADWDPNGDGKISSDEVALILDVAYGIRSLKGELLRQKNGSVVDWKFFGALDPDGNGKVTREEYFKKQSQVDGVENWYRSCDKNDDGEFDYAEFCTGGHRTDPIATFLGLDADLNAVLNRSELASLPPHMRSLASYLIPAFDVDNNGALSLDEFLMTPIPTLYVLASWQAAQDVNVDGKLSLEEFRFARGPSLIALSAEYFQRLDVNKDNSLSLEEWPFQTSHPLARFQSLDKDVNQELSETEFTTEGSVPADRLRRDFHLFDADSDSRMTMTEFLSLPYWIPDELRSPVTDPVVMLSKSHFEKLTGQWKEWDRDADGWLSPSEFSAAGIPRQILGLEMTGFGAWDLDQDHKITMEEVAQLLDIAFGVRTPKGELLRDKGGYVVDWPFFRSLTADGNERVSRQKYLTAMAGVPNREEWYRGIAKDGSDSFDFAEYSKGGHRTDPVGTFLRLDADLNGKLSLTELKELPDDWRTLALLAFRGFDDDNDGACSLREYQLMPHCNLLASWQGGHDRNYDGKLSQNEFQNDSGVAIAALSAEYFRRLDIDHDGKLSLKEWTFNVDLARVPRDVAFQQRDRDNDGRLTLEELQGDLRRNLSNGPANSGLETALVRVEEAFHRADANHDGMLDRTELASEDGLEAIAPGSVVRSKSTVVPPTIPIANSLGMDEESVRTYIIIEFNILLVVALGIYLYRHRGKNNA